MCTSARYPPVASKAGKGNLFGRAELLALDGFKAVPLWTGRTVLEAKAVSPTDHQAVVDFDVYVALEIEQLVLRGIHDLPWRPGARFPRPGVVKGVPQANDSMEIDYLTRSARPGNPGSPEDDDEVSAVFVVSLPRSAATVDFSDRALAGMRVQAVAAPATR